MAKNDANQGVIDVESQTGTIEIPAKMYEKVVRYRDRARRIRLQRKDSSGGSWRFKGGSRGIAPLGSMEPEEMCQIALEMARKHYEEHPDDGAKYRAVYEFGDGGQGVATIDALFNENGGIEFEDAVDDGFETERERVLAAALEDARSLQREHGSLSLEAMKAYTDSIKSIGSQVEDMCKGIAQIAQAQASATKGTADAMLQAGQLYRESQSRTLEQERIAAEKELALADQAQSDKKWSLVQQALMSPVAIAGVGKKVLGLGDEQAVQLAQMAMALQQADPEDMQAVMGELQAGAHAMAGQQQPQRAVAAPQARPQAPAGGQARAPQGPPQVQVNVRQQPAAAEPVPPQWAYPGPLDVDAIPGADDETAPPKAAYALGLWFFERDEDEERALREIVGPRVYDGLRAAPLAGDDAARSVLVDFGAQVGKLGMKGLTLLSKLKQTIGDDAVSAFMDLVKGARAGQL